MSRDAVTPALYCPKLKLILRAIVLSCRAFHAEPTKLALSKGGADHIHVMYVPRACQRSAQYSTLAALDYSSARCMRCGQISSRDAPSVKSVRTQHHVAAVQHKWRQ